ncbi:MAG: cation diffusion facilitator family transporter [Acetobacteraceae bacterium]
MSAPHHHHHHVLDPSPAGHAAGGLAFGRAFAVGAALNLGFVILEVIVAVFANSTALLGDAGHNLGDVLGLVAAWLAAGLALRLPSARFTYGLGSGTILASLANAAILLVSIGAILVEALRRLIAPAPVDAGWVAGIALVGIAVNAATAVLFAAGRHGDLNVRSVFQHMLADAVISAGVVVAALLVAATGWNRIDPLASILIVVVIGWTTWGLFRESLAMMLDAVPTAIRPDEVRACLLGLPGVAAIHDLHIWAMSTTETALTCHLVMPHAAPGPEFLLEAGAVLRERFGIGHPTLQVESTADVRCALAPDHVV